MIARTRRAAVPIDRSGDFLRLLRSVGLGEYREIPGNLAAFVLQRRDADAAHFVMLSFWESMESSRAYADTSIDSALNTPIDPHHAIELEPTVRHYTVLNHESVPRHGESVVARMWHGAVPPRKSVAYAHLMRTVALTDYKCTPGNLGVFILRRLEHGVAHFLNLTLWESRGAIQAFAGDDIERARYYEFDHEYLTEMEPTVLHFEVFGSLAVSDRNDRTSS